jgi:hypothetical protein
MFPLTTGVSLLRVVRAAVERALLLFEAAVLLLLLVVVLFLVPVVFLVVGIISFDLPLPFAINSMCNCNLTHIIAHLSSGVLADSSLLSRF